MPAGGSAPGDVIGWCELRIGSGDLTTDRPITRLHGAQEYIASFNLLGQGRLNQACGDLLYRRLMDEGVALDEVFDVVVCSESKAVGMVQVVAECFGQDRYVVLRKGLKNYMPRRPREPLVEDAVKLTVVDGDYYGTGKLYHGGWHRRSVLVQHSCRVIHDTVDADRKLPSFVV